MAGKWQEVTIESIASRIAIGPFGSDIKTDNFVSSGVPIIRGNNLTSGRFRAEEFVFLTEQKADQLANANAFPGDLVFTHRGTLGQVGLIPSTPYSRYVVSQSQMKLTCDLGKADPLFMYYFFRSPAGQHSLLMNTSQTGVPAISRPVTSLKAIRLALPAIPEQRNIAHILGTLDDKIDLNRRMNETLEAMARALFKSWFADLDRVRVTVAHLIEQGVLEIGDGYRAKNSELGEPGLPFIRAGDLDEGFETSGADVLRHESVARAASKISRVGDVAFTSKGTIGRFAQVTEHTPQFVYSPQVCFWRSLDPKRLRPAILYFWMQSEDLVRQIAAVAGQTDMALYVSLRDQRRMEMPVFPESQHGIAERLGFLLARQALAAQESKTLAAMRAALLPKLLSGELRVQPAERFVVDADA